MGRLIDADACPCNTCRTQCCENPRRCTFFGLWLLRQAYDVEKVVAELACNSRFIDDINEHNIKCISCVIGQKTAIDIVKRGGVEVEIID